MNRRTAITILSAASARTYAANSKLNIGIIGIAGMGNADAQAFSKAGENIAAICDPDSTVLEKRGAQYPQAVRYTDFRKMIENEKLDGVSVATPDHLHAYISIYAMRHGLHVYCQKPLTQTVHEARAVAKVARETKVITQMGTQSSADPKTLRQIELVQSGALGDITEVHLTTDRPVWPQGHDLPPGDDRKPDTLDWDLWLGPANLRPFRANWPAGHPVYSPDSWKRFIYNRTLPLSIYHPFTWRGWTEFGSGAVGDIAPHSMNVIFMALKLGPPQAVEVVETSGMRKDMYPAWSVIRWDWPNFKLYWYDGGKLPPNGKGGLQWIGTKSEPYERPPEREWNRIEVHQDWVDAVKAGKPAPCNFDYAAPFTEAYQLGNVALRTGHRIEWDAEAFRVTNCRDANQYLTREYRKGWELPS